MPTVLEKSKVAAILEKLDGLGAAPPALNRRRAQRLKIRMRCDVYLPSDPEPRLIRIHTRDVSTSGVGFLTRRGFALNQKIIVVMELPGSPKRVMLARIAYLKALDAGMYQVGAEFVELLRDPKRLAKLTNGWPADILAKTPPRSPRKSTVIKQRNDLEVHGFIEVCRPEDGPISEVAGDFVAATMWPEVSETPPLLEIDGDFEAPQMEQNRPDFDQMEQK